MYKSKSLTFGWIPNVTNWILSWKKVTPRIIEITFFLVRQSRNNLTHASALENIKSSEWFNCMMEKFCSSVPGVVGLYEVVFGSMFHSDAIHPPSHAKFRKRSNSVIFYLQIKLWMETNSITNSNPNPFYFASPASVWLCYLQSTYYDQKQHLQIEMGRKLVYDLLPNLLQLVQVVVLIQD